jgi:hypothetical protein
MLGSRYKTDSVTGFVSNPEIIMVVAGALRYRVQKFETAHVA